MSGHWVAPPVQGTSAASDMRTFIDRTHAERAAEVHANARRPLREPLVRAVVVRADDRTVGPNARQVVHRAVALGWSVRVTYARGWTPDKNGDEETITVMEPTGEILDSGRKQMRKVGVKEKPPVDSIRVLMRHPDDRLIIVAGHWLDDVFDFAMIHTDVWERTDMVTVMKDAVENLGPSEAYLF